MLRYSHDRIIVDSDLCNGRSTIRGHWLTGQAVGEFLVACDKPKEILEGYNFLGFEDIKACPQVAIKMALQAFNHRVYLPEAAYAFDR
jgi:uncharacterized protein (DUF433 family)